MEPIHPTDAHCPQPGLRVVGDLSCTLNQTDIKKNSNKFYLLQVLTDGQQTYLLTRYGRTGERGVVKLDGGNAESGFIKGYKTKTGYDWPNTGPTKPNKYTLMQLEAPKIEKPDPVGNKTPPRASVLAKDVEYIVGLISNRGLIEKTLQLFDIDTKKMPLGKISNQQLDSAQGLLSKIQSLIQSGGGGDEIVNLSSQFWTLIPYATKRSRPPPVLDTQAVLQTSSDMLDSLRHISCAGRIIEQHSHIDNIYSSLKTDIAPVDPTSAEFHQLATYIQSTHGRTHRYSLKLGRILSIAKVDDGSGAFGQIPNHKLLIHGSRMSNFMGILSEGLRVPRPDQVSNGSMLGPGIYFADCISKSFNYCCAGSSSNKGLILLCEVALGVSHNTSQATSQLLPPGTQSRMGLGQWAPDATQAWVKDVNVQVPAGKMSQTTVVNGSLIYNEYVIFTKEQYRFRYLIELDETR